jgi:hypothetical protein
MDAHLSRCRVATILFLGLAVLPIAAACGDDDSGNTGPLVLYPG